MTPSLIMPLASMQVTGRDTLRSSESLCSAQCPMRVEVK
jgi:hypothetical protein